MPQGLVTEGGYRVVYLTAAENVSGPLLSHPRVTDQPVVRSRIGFSAFHGVSLPACRHTDPALLDAPLPVPSTTAGDTMALPPPTCAEMRAFYPVLGQWN
jgi:hypothetical protein